ncbi:MAG: usg protein [Rhizobiales bacterium]|nr:usg protein [Hyphomicrobiales bacterium]
MCMTASTCSDFEKQMKGWSLTTAEILYRMPDHRSILQSYVWQDYDLAPRFPRLKEFLDFWERNLDGPLHSVRVAHASIIKPSEFRNVDAEWRLH